MPAQPIRDPADPGARSRGPRRLGSLAMLWPLARRYPGHIAGACLALLAASAATIAIPYGFGRVVKNGFGSGGDPAGVAQAFHYLLMIVMVLAVATALRFYFVSWLGERVVADLRAAVQRNLLRLDPRFFEENRPSEIGTRLTADSTTVEQVVGSTASVALRNVFTGIGGLIYLFILSPKLASLLVAGIPAVILPIVLLGRRVRRHSVAAQDRLADLGAMAAETLGAMKIVQAFGQEPREAARFGVAVENAFRSAHTRIAVRAAMTFIVIALLFGSVTLVIWEGASDVAAGRISGGAIASFVLTGAVVAGAFGALSEVYGDLQRGAAAAERLSQLLAEVPAIRAPATPAPLPLPAQGRIAFEAVRFRYPSRPERAALEAFTLRVEPGERVAVVGPSGAGKSTLLQLAQRFYDPEAGQVLLDGVDLRSVDPAAARARMAIVPQETVIFGASARDNLRYGRWDADEGAIWAAAEAASAAGFLRELPDGLDSFLGEAGARLSGGQRQRIAIARALLRDAPLLLLDEATSALDAASERLVQEALERLMVGRTTVVIAHRLATVRAADRIIVMDAGRIVEEGRHDQLIAAGGLYARLARLQFGSEAG
jgi:ATP-binding cassette, subfamily B, bacterial